MTTTTWETGNQEMIKRQVWYEACLELGSGSCCSEDAFDESLGDKVLDGAFLFGVRYAATISNRR